MLEEFAGNVSHYYISYLKYHNEKLMNTQLDKIREGNEDQ